MTLLIEDTLVSPINTPLYYAEVFIHSVRTGQTLMDVYSSVKTDENGNISFSLVQGDYRVYIQQREADIKYPIGYINASVFDTISSPTILSNIITEELESNA